MKIHAKLYKEGNLVLSATNGFCKDRSELPTRDDRLHHAIHAEMRILLQDKTPPGDKVLVMNLAPCWDCAKVLSESDIDEIWIPAEIPDRWRHGSDSCVDGVNLLIDSGKKIRMMKIDSGTDI